MSQPSSPHSLATLSTREITSRLSDMVSRERACIVSFLHHLGELDRRRAHLEMGYSSLWDYCVQELRFTSGTTFRRVTSARLLRAFPRAEPYLLDGRLSLGTFAQLDKVLTPENHVDLLERACGMSEDHVKALVAALKPSKPTPDSIRRLPDRPPRLIELHLGSNLDLSATANLEPNVECVTLTSKVEVEDDGGVSEFAPPAANDDDTVLVPMPKSSRPRIEPVDGTHYSVKMTVGSAFIAELDEVTAAVSHLVPDGNLEDVLRICFRKTLEEVARRKYGATKKQKPPQDPQPPEVPAPVTRAEPAVEPSFAEWYRSRETGGFQARRRAMHIRVSRRKEMQQQASAGVRPHHSVRARRPIDCRQSTPEMSCP